MVLDNSIPSLSFDELSSLNYSSETSFNSMDMDETIEFDIYHYINKLLEDDEINWNDTEIIYSSN